MAVLTGGLEGMSFIFAHVRSSGNDASDKMLTVPRTVFTIPVSSLSGCSLMMKQDGLASWSPGITIRLQRVM